MKQLNNDARFEHVKYNHTDLRKTFARVRREQRAAQAAPHRVVNINERSKRK